MSGLALEELVSSKIRLHLLTRLLTRPDERVYLRGVAKELQAPVTPVRRELQRLEAMGLLKTVKEGLLKFYWVDRTSPEFPRLLALIQQGALPVAVPAPAVQPVAPVAPTAPAAVQIVQHVGGAWRWGFAMSSAAFVITLVALVYVLRTNTSLMDIAGRAMSRTMAAAARQLPGAPPGGGELESSRWRVLPGSWGGYTPATAGPAHVKESY